MVKKEVKVKRKQKKRRVFFDKLKKTEEREECTLWSGERGTYVFERVPEYGERKPVRRVYLNRKYLSGLFTTKEKSEYSGDMKGADSRIYLIFKVVSPEIIEIFQKQ